MQDLRAEYGMAYLFISHDLAVVEYLCEDIVVLFRGTIVESGKTRDVMRNPMHPYTQELVAAMPRIGRRKRGVDAEPTAPVDRGPKDVSESGGCPYKARCPLAGAAMSPAISHDRPTPAPRSTTACRGGSHSNRRNN